jgi:site-specific recombinase XerD
VENRLTRTPSAAVTFRLEVEAAQGYASQAKAENTLRAYKNDWADFTAYCAERSLSSLPAEPETVAVYLSALAKQGKKAATLARRLSAISAAHLAEKLENPASLKHYAVKQVWDGIKRTTGTAQTRKQPVLTEKLRALVPLTPATLTGFRDRAILLLGFAAALRRSELVALAVEDIQYVLQGVDLTIRRSKTDQEGAGETIGIWKGREAATCPVTALQAWLEASGITAGPIFRPMTKHQTLRKGALTGHAVARIVKHYAQAAGFQGDFSGHSLRAGLATQAAKSGANERDIMRHTRHKSVTTLRKYIREGERYANNVSGSVGL